MDRIAILVTGGTFDKEYDELKGRLFFRHSHVREMLQLGRSRVPVAVRELFMMDSLDMRPADRKRVLKACRAAREHRIVITHGTDTMVETARLLGPRVPGKTIVLTGAMRPYKFGSSDGMFNLASSLSFAQTLPPGVYIAMNGRCLPWDRARKDRARGVFVAADR